MSWKSKFTSHRDKTFVESEVAGNKLRFYPNRYALLTEAKDLSAPVAKALSVLFADDSRDTKSQVVRQNEKDGSYAEQMVTEAVSKEMAVFRQKERERAIEDLLGVMADMRARLVIGKLLMDSLRDEFPYKADRPIAEVEEFLYGSEQAGDGYTGIDLPVFAELVHGWIKANAKVFGKLGEKMVGVVKGKLEALNASRSASPQPTSGENSKMPSSAQ